MRRDTWDNTRKAWFGSDYPFTIGLMVFQFIGLILLVSSPQVMYLFTLAMPAQMLHVWRYFTYSVMPEGGFGTGLFFNYLFTAGLTYWFCGSLERSWGTRTFVIFYAVLSVISALALIPAGYILASMTAKALPVTEAANLFGAIGLPVDNRMPIYASAVAWGVLNADEMITVFFIPMRGIFISLIAALVVTFDYAQLSPIAIPFALVGCAFAYKWVRHDRWSPSVLSYGMPARPSSRPKLKLVPKSQKPMDDRFTWRDLNPFERIARKRREKQLQKLLGDD